MLYPPFGTKLFDNLNALVGCHSQPEFSVGRCFILE